MRKVLEVDENFPLALDTLGAICAQQGRFEEALSLTERAYGFTPWASPTVGQLAALLVRSGETNRANTLLEKLRSGEVCGAPAGLALFHAMRGEFDRAVEWAERAVEERHPLLVRTLRPLLGVEVVGPGEKDESAMKRWLRTSVAMVVAAGLMWTSGLVGGPATQPGERQNLSGAWELVSLQDHRPNGNVLDWMGKNLPAC